MSFGKPGRPREDRLLRQREIFGAVAPLVLERGARRVTMRDAARAAYLSVGALYHYFPTKRDLYVAGLREIADELVERVTSLPRDVAPIDRLRNGLDAYLDHISQHSRAYVSLMRGGIGSDPEVAAVVEGVRRRLTENFLEQTPFAHMLAPDPRFQIAMRGWIGFCEGATIDWCANPRMSRVEMRDLLTQILGSIMTVVAPQVLQAK